MMSLSALSLATRSLSALSFRSFALGFAGTLAVAAAYGVNAQAFAGQDTNAPVDFAADRIQLQDRENRVVLTGGVVIRQAALTLRAERALINYTDTGGLQIDRLTATGGVTVTRNNETVRGQVAVYDFDRRLITMSGDVRVARGTDNLRGGRLVIDLRSGVATVDGSAGGPGTSAGPGRVTGSFTVPQN
ncbi:LptA/OstA family protein [Porphyrobacter sp. GA68]|uniref:LptA/OstA family protein n=1 Tax=Porphyrobacter sp. GA68 TaxID=2883480 RepID=UPI001D18E817|nr:LptA/OstA family protein [Porphyrobacter sp. GA68]